MNPSERTCDPNTSEHDSDAPHKFSVVQKLEDYTNTLKSWLYYCISFLNNEYFYSNSHALQKPLNRTSNGQMKLSKLQLNRQNYFFSILKSTSSSSFQVILFGNAPLSLSMQTISMQRTPFRLLKRETLSHKSFVEAINIYKLKHFSHLTQGARKPCEFASVIHPT